MERITPSWPFPFFVKGNGRAFRFGQGWVGPSKQFTVILGVVVMMNAVCRTFTIGRFLAPSWPFPFFVKGNGRAFRFGRGGWTFKKIYSYLGVVVKRVSPESQIIVEIFYNQELEFMFSREC